MTASHVEQFVKFAGYNRWFNDRLYEVAASLTDAKRKEDLGAFFGSVHRTLNHILLADRIWLGRIRRSPGGFASLDGADLLETFGSLGDELFPEWDDLRAARTETDAVLVRFAAELAPEHLGEVMRYRTSKGQPREHVLWIALAHLWNHQTHHRGQVTTLLHQLGKDPGVTDFLVYATL